MLKVGDRIPDAALFHMTAEGPQKITTSELFDGKKVVLFALPGAYTPTCSAKHVPGFVSHIDKFKEKGVDTVACLSVNDPFVMGAWGKDQKADGKVLMLADGVGEFTKAAGMDFDASAVGLGVRSKRYALYAEDGVVKALNVEENPGALENSSAERILQAL